MRRIAPIHMLGLLLTATGIAHAYPSSVVRVDEYIVREGDTMYLVSLSVFSDEERLDGAHWLTIFEFNVLNGNIDPKRTPIFVGFKGLSIHIEPGQRLMIPRYAGVFPDPAEIAEKYGVYDELGNRLSSIVLDFPQRPTVSIRRATIQSALGEANATALGVSGRSDVAAHAITVVPEAALYIAPPAPAFDLSESEEPLVIGSAAILDAAKGPDAVNVSAEDAFHPCVVAMNMAPASPASFDISVPHEATFISIVPTAFSMPDRSVLVVLKDAASNEGAGWLAPSLAEAISPPHFDHERAAREAAIADTRPTPEAITRAREEAKAEAIAELRAQALGGEATFGRRAADHVDGVEFAFAPGAAFYEDVLGAQATVSVAAPLSVVLEKDGWYRDVLVGAGAAYQQVLAEDIPVLMAGLDLRLGYRIDLERMVPDIPRALGFRFIPSIGNAILFQKVDRTGREVYLGPAYRLAGGFSADLAPFKDRTIRLGAEAAYNLYFSGLSLANVTAGLFISRTFR